MINSALILFNCLANGKQAAARFENSQSANKNLAFSLKNTGKDPIPVTNSSK